jgi:hypothetical protein
MGSLVGAFVSPLLSLAFGKKPKPAPQPVPQPVAQVRPNGGVADALARRRGSRANQKTGSGGAEAGGGGKTTLGS